MTFPPHTLFPQKDLQYRVTLRDTSHAVPIHAAPFVRVDTPEPSPSGLRSQASSESCAMVEG